MGHYKVMIGGECYGRGTQQECQGIINMHKTVLNGHRKETKISTMEMKIEFDPANYPFDYKPLAPLGYKTNVRSAELK